MTDPYKVLGVSRDATDEEIKKAYHELVKKYHPDNYTDNPLADLVEEKMKEINEAYDTIQKQRSSGGKSGQGYSSGGGYTGYDDYSSSQTKSDFYRIREIINSGRYSDADIMLDSIAQGDRNAEWNFLKGCVLIQRGWYFDAQKYLETACYMDPGNAEYRNMLSQIRTNTANYGGGYRQTRSDSNCSACDMCSSLICADCLCEACGGDLIRCC